MGGISQIHNIVRRGLSCLLVDENPNDGVMLQRELVREFPDLSFYQACPTQPFNEWVPANVQPALCILDWSMASSDVSVIVLELEQRWLDINLLVFCRETSVRAQFESERKRVGLRVLGVTTSFADLLELAKIALADASSSLAKLDSSERELPPKPDAQPRHQSGLWDFEPFGVAVVSSRTHRVHYANPFLCELLGIPRSTPPGFRLDDIHHADAVRKIVTAMRTVSRGIKPAAIEVGVNPIKGDPLMMDVMVSEAGTHPEDCFTVYYLDATERRSLERKLRRVADAVANAESGREFFQSLVTGLAKVLEVDIALVCRVRSGALKALAGWVHGSLSQNLQMPLAGFPAERVMNHHLICVTRDFRKEFPAATWMTDREVESYMGIPVTGSSGEVIGMIQIMHSKPLSKTKDLRAVLLIFATRVTAEMNRLANEETLQERERLMLEAESITGMGSWAWSIVADRVHISDEGLRIIGLSSLEPSANLEWGLGLLHPDDQPKGRKLIENALHDKGSFNEALRLLRPTGETRWIQVQGKVICDEESAPIRISGVFLDITEKRKLLRQSEAFSKLGHQLSAAKTKMEAARIILGVAGEVFDVEAAAFSLRDSRNSNSFSIILNVDTVDGVLKEFEPSPDRNPPTALQKRIMEHGPQLILRQKNQEEADQMPTVPFGVVERRSASIMAVPIRHDHECIGFLSIQSYRFNAYSSEDVPVLQSLADHSAGALLRVDAADEARRNHELLRLVVDSLPAYVAYVSADHRYLLVNNRYEKWFNRPRSEIEGVPIRDCLPSKVYQSAIGRIERALQGETVEFEIATSQADGASKHLHVHYVPHRLEDGNTSGIVGLVTDVSSIRSVEVELKEVTRRLEVAQRIGQIGNWDWNISTDTLWWSKETFRLFGLDPTKPAPSRNALLSLIHPEDVEQVNRAMDKCLADRAPYTTSYRIPQPDGKMRVVEVHGEVTADDAGKPLVVAGTIQDVTVRRTTELALRTSEEKFRVQYQAMPLPSFTWQFNGSGLTLIEGNPAAWRFTEGLLGLFLGKTAEEIFPDEPDIISGLSQCYREKIYITRDLQSYRMRTTGKIKQLRAHVNYVAPDMVILHVDDMTERLQAESRQRAILQLIPYRLFRFDQNGVLLDCHANNPDKLLLHSDDIVGKSFRELLPPETVRIFEGVMTAALNSTEVQKVTYSLPKDGRTHYLECRVVHCGNSEFLAMVQDISEGEYTQGLKASHRRQE